MARTRHAFWTAKRRENLDRDRRQTLALQSAGWTVVRLLECDVWERLDDTADWVEAAVRHRPRPLETTWRIARVEVEHTADDIECRYLEALHDPTRTATETGRRVPAKARRR